MKMDVVSILQKQGKRYITTLDDTIFSTGQAKLLDNG
jgi:hypothetical protein